MLYYTFLLLLLLSGTTAAAASAVPPLAHELDESYSFDQYAVHFDKSYDDPNEYVRRSRIFTRNLRMILDHNNGRLTEEGEIIGGGYVMGVNAFTDIDVEELPLGYNKHVRASASLTSHLRVGDSVLEIERRQLGGTESYSVRVKSLLHAFFLTFDTYICFIVNLTLVMSSIDFCYISSVLLHHIKETTKRRFG